MLTRPDRPSCLTWGLQSAWARVLPRIGTGNPNCSGLSVTLHTPSIVSSASAGKRTHPPNMEFSSVLVYPLYHVYSPLVGDSLSLVAPNRMKAVKQSQPAAFIHENVARFPAGVLETILEPDYAVWKTAMCPQLFGFPVARDRQYCLCIRTDIQRHDCKFAEVLTFPDGLEDVISSVLADT